MEIIRENEENTKLGKDSRGLYATPIILASASLSISPKSHQ